MKRTVGLQTNDVFTMSPVMKFYNYLDRNENFCKPLKHRKVDGLCAQTHQIRGLLQLIMMGKAASRQKAGYRKKLQLQNVQHWTGCRLTVQPRQTQVQIFFQEILETITGTNQYLVRDTFSPSFLLVTMKQATPSSSSLWRPNLLANGALAPIVFVKYAFPPLDEKIHT